MLYPKKAKELYRELQIYQRVFNNISRSLPLPLMLGMFDVILTFSGYSLIAHYKTLEFFSLIMLLILLVYSLMALSLFKFMELIECTCADFSRQLNEQCIWLRNKYGKKISSETHKFARSLLPLRVYWLNAYVTQGLSLRIMDKDINNIILLLINLVEN